MNLILLNELLGKQVSDFEQGHEFKLAPDKARHVTDVIRAQVGDLLRIGLPEHGISQARVVAIGSGEVILARTSEWVLSDLLARPVLIMGLPRPKVFRRILRAAIILGYKEIHFCHSYRVEKSYWSSPMLEARSVEQQVILGLEQAQDVRMPDIKFHRLFKPFFEDQVAHWVLDQKLSICAHPYGVSLPKGKVEIGVLALGPEGGWIDYEIKLMEKLGFQTHSFSERILSCETALPFITGGWGD